MILDWNKKTFTSPKIQIWDRSKRNTTQQNVYNQIITLNVPFDISLPVFKYNFKKLFKHNQIRDDLMS